MRVVAVLIGMNSRLARRGGTVTIVHTSDLHLGAPSLHVGTAHHRDCLCPLRAVAESIQASNADVLLIAGDLFDHNRVDLPLVRQACKVLGNLDAEIVVLPGNHDSISESSVYLRFADLWQSAGVQVLTRPEGMTLRLARSGLEVWGRPTVEHTTHTRPLATAPARRAGGRYVVLAHGHYTESTERNSLWPERAAPITHADLLALTPDYFALGHRDLQGRVGPESAVAWYSGAPMLGGVPRSVLIVTLTDPAIHVAPWPVRQPSSCALP